MGVATEARRVLESLPAPTREALESTVSFVPRSWLYGRTFRATRAMLARSERMPLAELRARQDARVRELVAWAHARVPYYREVFAERGLRPADIRGALDLPRLPLLTKEILRERADDLLAEGMPPSAREQVSTGGTSGTPLKFWIDRGRSAQEWAFMTWQWGRVGYFPGMRRAVLRGNALEGERIHAYRPLLDELALSTFRLTAGTLPRYLEQIERYRPVFLHAYPSSAEHFARLLRAVPEAKRPRFEAVLLGSENVYPAQREFLAQAFGAKVFAWYGHSEKCLLGGGCEQSDDYHLYPEYGVLEVLDDAGNAVEPGERGTIVGTGFLNRVMPFLRYATDDRATLVEGPCACGRAYPRVRDIEGRWHGERLFGDGGRVFSMTALNTHSTVFDRVARFRIRQDRAGEATVVVVPASGFGDADARAITADYHRRAAGTVRFRVEVVEELPLTGRGKFKFIEQRIPDDVQAELARAQSEVP
ncbi:MAG: phenylacetate--CoA ligase family protein [Candidatus Eisenbacteria bacterium]